MQPHSRATRSPVRPWYVSAVAALLAVAVLLGGLWGYTRLKSPFPYYGTVYDTPQPAAAFSGLSASGPYSFAPAGQTTALFFGFTHCPDICPITLAYLERVRKQLTPAQQRGFRVVFVSLDPDRDTPQKIGSYTRYFGSAQGVQVKEPALAALARSYAVSYVKAPLPGGGYQINHTSATFLIDSLGRKRLLWDYTQLSDTARVVRDIQQVMQ
ncbi:SCO family protein [Deinococcus sp. KNUC1210]|uniref:SCO family protein n=1 Tax=Deinococcus sp. KNUC1210 TaxID=2917691 RepID=UPI001EEFE8CB|nr:SCO family protein [Deinococcus sp. KNUC1210]ULH16299.1 SCO family protein [Deinococcus sp. KNUC1210]